MLRSLVARLGAKLLALLVPFIILGIAWVGVQIYRVFENRQNHLVVLNHTGRDLSVTVGAETKTAHPHHYAVFFGVPGDVHTVSATGFEPKPLAFPDRAGNRGILAFGGPAHIALVKRASEKSDSPALDSIEVLPVTDGLLLLPAHATEYRPDQHFYPAKEIDDSIFDCRVRACTYDSASRELGCGICRGTWKTCTNGNFTDLERLHAPL